MTRNPRAAQSARGRISVPSKSRRQRRDFSSSHPHNPQPPPLHLPPPLPLLSRLLPPLLLWRLLPPYFLPSRHQFPRVYARGLRGLRNEKLAWGLSQVKAKDSPRNGRPLKRGRSRARGPRLLSKIRQKQQEIERELAMPAQISKALLQNQVGLLFSNIAKTTTIEHSNVITEAPVRVEFTYLIFPKRTISSSRTTPPQSRVRSNSTIKTKKQQTTVPGSLRSAAAVKVAAKKAAPKVAAAKKRAREEDEDEEDGHTPPAKKSRVTKAPDVPKPKKNHQPCTITKAGCVCVWRRIFRRTPAWKWENSN